MKNKKNKLDIRTFSRNGVVEEVWVGSTVHTIHRLDRVNQIAILFNVIEARFIECPFKLIPALSW
jgi:hypothetical protein